MTQDTHGSQWLLRLYINGTSPHSMAAISNLQQICEKHLARQYQIEVIDLLEQPHLAEGDQIVAVPTVVRRLPIPIRKVIGDLSDMESTLIGLQIKPC